ncbi:hypothetical protein [Mycobacteroides abscessus]|nr:hypothetical protein [Mycobacteroides abscessus]
MPDGRWETLSNAERKSRSEMAQSGPVEVEDGIGLEILLARLLPSWLA